MSFSLTKHAQCRAQQRGFRREDIDLLLSLGTETADGILLKRREADEYVRLLKHEIARVERLVDRMAITAEDRVVTVYRPSKRNRRRVLRRSI